MVAGLLYSRRRYNETSNKLLGVESQITMLWGPWKYMSEDSLRAYLRAGAQDWVTGQFMYDDLIGRKLPKECEQAFIEAAQAEDIFEPYEYLMVCASQLLRMGSDWEGLSGLLVRLVDLSPGISTYSLVYEYLRQRRWNVPPELGRRVRETYSERTRLHKFFISLDGPSRAAVKNCAVRIPIPVESGSAINS